jgi:flagellar hook-associated protein 3 FlgL
MKVSTSIQFDRASTSMSNLQNELAISQAKISSQKQVLNPSDAPGQAANILRLHSIIDRQTTFGRTIESAQTRLNNEDSALSSANDAVIRIKELTIQASNGTQDSNSRQVIATEMAGLRDHLLSLANTTDTTGNYIFSGSKVRTPPFLADAAGTVAYRGDQTRMRVEIGEQRTVTINRPGTSAFVRVVRKETDGSETGRGFFQAVDDLIAAVRAQGSTGASGMQRGLAEMDALQTGLNLAQADAGTDLNILDLQNNVLEDTKLNLKTVLSKSEDLDITAAITQMHKQLMSLQAAQSSFAKISELTLFSYLR